MNNYRFCGSGFSKTTALQWGFNLDYRSPTESKVIVLRGAAITLSPSSNITDGQATTAQLTAPSGKTSGADFQAGIISEDVNPLPSLNLASGKYTELEFCMIANPFIVADGEIYEFRISYDEGGTPLESYLVSPEWTIGTAGPGGGLLGPIFAGKCINNKIMNGSVLR